MRIQPTDEKLSGPLLRIVVVLVATSSAKVVVVDTSKD